MVKKLKALANSDDKQFADAVRASAQQIWQAGLGAFGKAQEEGGKVFAKLVKEGSDLQRRTKSLAEGKVAEVSGTVSKVADSVGKQAAGSWDKLEKVFEERVARALTTLGVPTKADVQALTKRVAELNKAVDALSGKKPAAAKTATKTATKTSAKTATKTAAKTAAKVATKAASKPTAKPVAKAAAPAAKKAVKEVAAKVPSAKKAPANEAASAEAAV